MLSCYSFLPVSQLGYNQTKDLDFFYTFSLVSKISIPHCFSMYLIKRNQITESWQNVKQQNDQTSLALLMERSYLYNDENISAGKTVGKAIEQ